MPASFNLSKPDASSGRGSSFTAPASLRFIIVVLLAMLNVREVPAGEPLPRVPAGFVISQFAGDDLAHDIYRITFDEQGRLLASGRGYFRFLLDEDGDGKADRSVLWSKEARDGATGLLWENGTLYFTGDGGLRRLRTSASGEVAEGRSELLLRLKTGGEHCAHAVRRGPDGRLYVLCGNNTDVDATYGKSPTSPIKQPVAGVVLRLSDDLKTTEIVADGFRNPYDMDFSLDGELFTFDSDNERCVSLPWYEHTRFYHVRTNGFHGWLSPQRAAFWRFPPYFDDVVPPIATLGRGSPTGVVCYKHSQFPAKYRGGMFLADWTFGKVHFVPLERKGDTYVGAPNTFLEPTGGFAPTSLAVHPKTGELFVSIGGRGTRGGVYRIRYTAPTEGTPVAKSERNPSPPVARPWTPDFIGEKAWTAATRAWSEATTERARLSAVRRAQRAIGDIDARCSQGTAWEGYRRPDQPLDFVAEGASFSLTGCSANVDREVARLWAMLGSDDEKLRDALTSRWSADSDPVDDVHFLIAFASLPGRRSEEHTKRTVEALLGLDRKIRERHLHRDTNWQPRIRELAAGLGRFDGELFAKLVDHREFGRADHLVFASAPGFPREKAARAFLAKVKADDEGAWPTALPDLLGVLPTSEVLPLVRERWGRTGVESQLLTLLSAAPVAEDRSRFREGLRSGAPSVVRAALTGLSELGPATVDDVAALLLCSKRLPPAEKDSAKKLASLLATVPGGPTPNAKVDAPAWIDWLKSKRPEEARKLENPDGVDVVKWQARLAKIEWSIGDSTRGSKIFEKASCRRCHSGAGAVGPDLAGIGKRFSRDDLLTAILQPSRDVPARYQTVVVETSRGTQVSGAVIYDAVDSLLLSTPSGETVRLGAEDIVRRTPSPVSLMPPGLLDALSDGEIRDLLAFLRSMP